MLISFRVTIADSMVLHNQSIKFYIDWTEERNEQLRRRLLADGSLEEAVPQHGSRKEQSCSGIGSVTTKQRRKMKEISTLTAHPLPDMDSMTFDEADVFLAERFADWMSHDYPRY